MGSRNLENGLQAIEKLKAESLTNLEAIQMNVSDNESVKAARAEIGKKTEVLDVLINNAGISGGMSQTTSTDIALSMHVRTVFESGIDTISEAIKFIPSLLHPILEHKPPMLNLIQVW